MARIYNLQSLVLSSLWYLFRGKKRNVLKQRIDSYDYSIDQLLLGTLLFTVLVFLLPTIWIYYLFFFCARVLLVICFQLFPNLLLELLNHFPVHAFVLYLFNSGVLSGGIRFEIYKPSGKAQIQHYTEPTPTYLLLHNCKIPTGVLFHELSQSTSRVLHRYSATRLLQSFVFGHPII